jgi:hypothetical protein
LDPTNIQAISQFPVPFTITNVHSFLGLTGYYKSFIHGYAKIFSTLFELTKKDLPFKWTPQCQMAFDTLKQKLLQPLVSIRPDFLKMFVLDMDSSIKAVGAILSQKNGR